MGCAFALWVTTSLSFYALGAWPIAGFLGLDFLLLYLAFKLSYRQARCFEEIMLSQNALIIRQIDAKGKEQRHHFNPYWVHFNIHRTVDEGVTELSLCLHERVLKIGSFLNPEDKESFGYALKAALKKARRPLFS